MQLSHAPSSAAVIPTEGNKTSSAGRKILALTAATIASLSSLVGCESNAGYADGSSPALSSSSNQQAGNFTNTNSGAANRNPGNAGANTGTTTVGQVCELPVQIKTVSDNPFVVRDGNAAQIAQGGAMKSPSWPIAPATDGSPRFAFERDLQSVHQAGVVGGSTYIAAEAFKGDFGATHLETVSVSTIDQGTSKIGDRAAFADLIIHGAGEYDVDGLVMEAALCAMKPGVTPENAPQMVENCIQQAHPAVGITNRAGNAGFHDGENCGTDKASCVNLVVENLNCQPVVK